MVALSSSRKSLIWFLCTHRTLIFVLWIAAFSLMFWRQTSSQYSNPFLKWTPVVTQVPEAALLVPKEEEAETPIFRPVVLDLTDFGAVGDGKTLNTQAFERAVAAIAERGGGRLVVPSGSWLTAPFNLTSHMTLFLAEGSEILGVQDENYWPLLPPLPSYGYGREHKGLRYGSLIHGQNLKNVVITGNNGTINGQGDYWWTKFKSKLLNHTRGPLVQLMWSEDIVISNIRLMNSPFWTLHPFDCKNVTISNVTILAPVTGAPNTDGIDPDSSKDMVIENCYICVGDDAIAIKSGWDQYGIAYGHPSSNILIRNVTVRSMVSAGVSIGSEMSGGVENVTVENLHVWNSKRGIRIKTAPGRGAYVRNITYRNVILDQVEIGIVVQTDYNEHPDEGFNPFSVPVISNISFSGIRGRNVQLPVQLSGSKEIPVKGVVIRDMDISLGSRRKHVFRCSYVEGRAIGSIHPEPCKDLSHYDEHGFPLKTSYGGGEHDRSLAKPNPKTKRRRRKHSPPKAF